MMAKRTVRIPIWAICACVHCTQWQWQRRWRHYRPTNKNHSTFEIIAQNKSERTTERPRAISIAWYNNTYSNCLLRIRRMIEAIQRALMAVVFLLEFAARFSIHVLTSNLRYIRGLYYTCWRCFNISQNSAFSNDKLHLNAVQHILIYVYCFVDILRSEQNGIELCRCVINNNEIFTFNCLVFSFNDFTAINAIKS